MRVVVTGADGFLGWHTRVRLRALTGHEVVPVSRHAWPRLEELVAGADAVLHLAGVNRADDNELELANLRLAQDLVEAVESARVAGDGRAPDVIYANTIHADSDTAYGRGKARAAEALARASAGWGRSFTDVRFPNLFGESGRPRYNSFVATFVDAVACGQPPASVVDREIDLLHAQDAAEVLLAALAEPRPVLHPRGTPTTVRRVLDTLTAQFECYRTAQFPDLRDQLDLDLFNTLRARLFPDFFPMPLQVRSDERGRLVEIVRSVDGPGQVFVSTTRPGSTRGEHYHLRKIERFAVVGGRGRISLRRVCGGPEVISFDVDGQAPAVVDMPTMWVHNITNTGDTDLVTMFWTNELFDPDAPDTYWEPVSPEPDDRQGLACSR